MTNYACENPLRPPNTPLATSHDVPLNALFNVKFGNVYSWVINILLQMPSTEPFIMDSLSLALTGGPNGYRINLKDMEVYGASNFTVKSIK